MADGEASGEQRLDDPVESPTDAELGVAGRDEYQFDAFDATSWQFTPTPVPWHHTPPAILGFIAVGLALVVLTVAVALLARRSEDAVPATSPVPAPTPTAQTTTATTSSATAPSTTPVDAGTAPSSVPTPVPIAPPPESSGSVTHGESRPAKKPEFNVTRTPMSVRPPPRGASR